MIKNNELLVQIEVIENNEKIIDLEKIYPLGKIKYIGIVQIELSHDGDKYFSVDVKDCFDNETARFIKIKSNTSQVIEIFMGLGYVAYKNHEFEKLFIRKSYWTGADGIYSFNLEKKEDYNQQDDKTLFVFGDTFMGFVNEQGNRIEPTAMVNNTLAYYKNGNIHFEAAKDVEGNFVSLFNPDERILQRGYDVKYLTIYHGDEPLKPYISELNFTKDIEIYFDVKGIHEIVKIEIENYHDDPEFGVSTTSRGASVIDVYSSIDGNKYEFIERLNLEKYSKEKQRNSYDIAFKARYIKFVLPVNENGNDSYKEDKIVGLKKVYFYQQKGQLYDVKATSNSSFFKKSKESWFWLQDGIIKDDKLFIYPCVIEEELNGIEGYEFKMVGVTNLIVDIKDKKIDYNSYQINQVPLYKIVDGKEYMFPIAIHQEDDYAYFYGYYNELKYFLRHLIVARIKISEIEDLNNLEFFDGENWVNDMESSKSILQHISCEMSVQKIVEGENKGKYLAVFQYDTNGPKVAYAIGESVCGPFSKPRVVYVAEEVKNYNVGTTYVYNAKSHLHLSSPKNILVSYNCNDMSMAKNKMDYSIYHPRFLNLLDTSND